MQSEYQQLVRSRTSRGLLRELGFGVALLIAIVMGCLLLPEMPGESLTDSVSSAPPGTSQLAPGNRVAPGPTSTY